MNRLLGIFVIALSVFSSTANQVSGQVTAQITLNPGFSVVDEGSTIIINYTADFQTVQTGDRFSGLALPIANRTINVRVASFPNPNPAVGTVEDTFLISSNNISAFTENRTFDFSPVDEGNFRVSMSGNASLIRFNPSLGRDQIIGPFSITELVGNSLDIAVRNVAPTFDFVLSDGVNLFAFDPDTFKFRLGQAFGLAAIVNDPGINDTFNLAFDLLNDGLPAQTFEFNELISVEGLGFVQGTTFSPVVLGNNQIRITTTDNDGGTTSEVFNLNVVPEGDLDGDGFVGIADLNLVLANWNQNIPPGNPLADPTGDGFVGINDLNEVLGNWNAGTPPGAPPQDLTNVPEPASLLIFACLLGLIAPRRIMG